MIHLSRMLLFIACVIVLCYEQAHSTQAAAPFLVVLLIIASILAFLRAISSEYDSGPRPSKPPNASGTTYATLVDPDNGETEFGSIRRPHGNVHGA